MTEVTIVGNVIGTYWWPIDVPWSKETGRTFRRTHDRFVLAEERETLREMVEAITDDGDSSMACKIEDGLVVVRRYRATGVHERTTPLERFASIRDYLV